MTYVSHLGLTGGIPKMIIKSERCDAISQVALIH